jgi:uroporphyrin-III C-methyltransferase
VHCGKRGGAVSTQQGFIEAMLVAEALRGERVVRLKGATPTSSAAAARKWLRCAPPACPHRGARHHRRHRRAGPGIPVTDRRWAQGVLLVTGHAQPGGAGPDWAQLAQAARGGITLVIYMGITHGADITAALMAAGLAGSTPAAVVQNGCTPRSRAPPPCARWRATSGAWASARRPSW